MMPGLAGTTRALFAGTRTAMAWLVLVPAAAVAQLFPPQVRTTDSVTVKAGAHYQDDVRQ